jgi:hypothetical protein
MKVIIAGSRDITDYNLILKAVKEARFVITEVVCGGARGVDRLGKEFAEKNHISIKFFIPDWDGKGKAAGHIRNREMVDYADALIAIWDGKSAGTKGMIDYATKKGLKVYVMIYKLTD